jgi:ubiquinone/menaquinone biosynthesis C-methylase UbiE
VHKKSFLRHSRPFKWGANKMRIKDISELDGKELTPSNIWDVYAFTYNRITPSFQAEMLKNAARKAHGRVLDAGCGVGKLIPYLENEGNYESYVGVDSNKSMLEYAQDFEDRPRVTILSGDVTDLQSAADDSSLDTLVSMNVLYSVKDYDAAISEHRRVLKKGGQFLLSGPLDTCNFEFLVGRTYAEFEEKIRNDSVFKEVWDIYIKCNTFLIKSGKEQGYSPNMFSSDGIVGILEKHGFKIAKKESAYLGQSYFISCEKA